MRNGPPTSLQVLYQNTLAGRVSRVFAEVCHSAMHKKFCMCHTALSPFEWGYHNHHNKKWLTTLEQVMEKMHSTLKVQSRQWIWRELLRCFTSDLWRYEALQKNPKPVRPMSLVEQKKKLYILHTSAFIVCFFKVKELSHILQQIWKKMEPPWKTRCQNSVLVRSPRKK